MTLNYKLQGQGEPLIILHGLLGMLDNWQTLARRFADHYAVYTLDLRNHGRSPHSADMDYHLMAQDVVDFMDEHNIQAANILGHSMGGKVAMQLAVSFPARVTSLIPVDIAPKRYLPGHEHILEALSSVEPEEAETRTEIEEELVAQLHSLPIARFLMKNLARKSEGGFEWKMNLNAIRINYDKIIGEIEEEHIYDGPALFIRGGKSGYVEDGDLDGIRSHFPNAKLITIENAGHWVHADQPDELFDAVIAFLSDY